MAAPAHKTMRNLGGRWVLNKSQSQSPEPALALQGIGWLTRKAISAATVSLYVEQYLGPASPASSPSSSVPPSSPSSSSPSSSFPPLAKEPRQQQQQQQDQQEQQEPQFTHIVIKQTLTGGIRGSTERRCLDGMTRKHSDWLFGRVRGRTRWASAAELADADGADGGGDEDDEEKDHYAFLRDGRGAYRWLADDGHDEGDHHQLVVGFVVSLDSDWRAAQAWGFMEVDGARKYCRLVRVTKGDQAVEFRLVYDWIGELEGMNDRG